MKTLFLADLSGKTEKEIKDHIADSYETPRADLNRYSFLIAYESVGSWGCDSSSFFLIRDKKTKELFEVNGSHCSCNEFEGQWMPEPAEPAALKLRRWSWSMGGYDDDAEEHQAKIKEYVSKLRERKNR